MGETVFLAVARHAEFQVRVGQLRGATGGTFVERLDLGVRLLERLRADEVETHLVLTREATDANDGFLSRVDEHHRHLKQDFELVRDDVGLTVEQRLCAIASLENETLAVLGLRDRLFQTFDLPRRYEWRKLP